MIYKKANKMEKLILWSGSTIVRASMALFFSAILSMGVSAQDSKVKNIVLVHGAFADGSGWQGVFKILTEKGYTVTVVQNPCTSLEDDVAAVDRALERQDGPVILVGHSWGGAVITQAGISPKVVALVYVDAFQPEVGESALTLGTKEPPAPENGIQAPDANGFLYFEKAKFHAGFCADLSAAESAFMAASQIPISIKAFTATLTQAAWKTKPSWGVIGTEDKSISPKTERWMYERSGTKITEIKGGSHVSFISHPKEVAEVIEQAAKGAVK